MKFGYPGGLQNSECDKTFDQVISTLKFDKSFHEKEEA